MIDIIFLFWLQSVDYECGPLFLILFRKVEGEKIILALSLPSDHPPYK